jgi:hypothetical protein
VDAKFSYQLNGGFWSDIFDTNGDIVSITNGGTLYFKVEPYTTGHMGTYLLVMVVTRETLSAIENVEENHLTVFPNPAKDEILIQSDLPIQKVEIYSLTGVLLLSENNFNGKISVSALTKGVYMVKIYTGKNMAIGKVIKE